MTTIITIDPGKTTGHAIWRPLAGGIPKAGQTEGSIAFCDKLWTTMNQESLALTVVCESYTINAGTLKKSRQYDPLEIIGAARWMAAKLKAEFLLQSPSEAKGFATDDKLKKIGWWQPGMDHAADAMRHMLLYGVKNQHVNPSDLL